MFLAPVFTPVETGVTTTLTSELLASYELNLIDLVTSLRRYSGGILREIHAHRAIDVTQEMNTILSSRINAIRLNANVASRVMIVTFVLGFP